MSATSDAFARLVERSGLTAPLPGQYPLGVKHRCKACDVTWHGEPVCWVCDRQV